MQKNILTQVKDDAVAEARASDPRLACAGANNGADDGTSINSMTRPSPTGETIGPFIVDETPVDSPLHYIL